MNKFILSAFSFFCFLSFVPAQTYNIGVNNNTTIANACGGHFYDSGGAGGDYGLGENDTITFCAPAGQYMAFNFTAFNTESGIDILYAYSGNNVTCAPLINSYSGTSLPSTIYSTQGGCVTFVFSSDAFSTASPGWAANITCSTTSPPTPPPGAACGVSNPFCTGTTYSFPNDTGNTNGLGQVNCLFSTPNPVFYYMQIANAGSLQIFISQLGPNGPTDSLDVDFNCWGPFTDLSSGCNSVLNCTSSNTVSCSYSANSGEYCNIPNAVPGQYYILLLTNFSNQPGTITFGQSGGTASTNCNIISCGVTASNTGPYCVGQTISLSAATTNTTATTYTWAGPNGFTAGGQNITIPNSTVAMSGTYSVTGTTGGTVTCVATTTVIVAANAAPSVTSSTICNGQTGTLTVSNAAIFTGFTWSTGATTASITDNPASTTVYTVTGATGTCTSSATGTITVVSNPTITANAGIICPGSKTTLIASGASSYNWSPATGLSNTTSSVVTANPLTTTIYTITGAVGTCSASAITTTITVNSSPTVTATGDAVCPGNIANLSAAGAISYTWASGTTPVIGNPVTAKPNLTTNYTVTGMDANTCTNTAVATATVLPLPAPSPFSSPACLNQTIGLFSANGFVSYLWTGPGGVFSSTLQNPTIANATIADNGTYTVTVKDAQGCSNSGFVSVTVYTLPIVTATGSSSVCLSSTGTLTATGASNYVWNPATDLNTTFGNQVLITPTSLLTHTYTILGQNSAGCINTTTISVSVVGSPIVNIMPDTVTGCAPLCITYTAISNPTASKYSWSFGNGKTANLLPPNDTVSTCYKIAGNYIPRLTLTDINGCVNTTVASVIVYPIPTPEFGYTPSQVNIFAPMVQFINQSTGLNIINYIWNFGDGSASSNFNNPSYTYSDTGTYYVTLKAYTLNGCSASVTQALIVEPDYTFYVPNAFTPNGDGKNDIFKAQGDAIISFKMNIFDRWGNNVFTTTDIDSGWDGRPHNKGNEIAKEDVYVWKIDLTNAFHQGKSYSGTVTLLR